MKLQTDILTSEAKFSEDHKYRYYLIRTWNKKLPRATFIGLNPSTATEQYDNPTTRRCIEFARREGCGSLCMLNIFAYRSTNPSNLSICPEPIGKDNNTYIVEKCKDSQLIVAAWGSRGSLNNRGEEVIDLLYSTLPDKQLLCLGKTKNQQSIHPLYQSSKTKLIPIISKKENAQYVHDKIQP